MFKEAKELSEDMRLRAERYNMSVEEIMADGHFNRTVAQAIWDADHGVNMSGPIPIDEYLQWLEDTAR